MAITKTTREYVLAMLAKGKRPDGRPFDKFRDIIIETGVTKTAEGSSRVKIGQTEVMAGVKMELGVPYPDTPNEGVLKTGAEFLALAAYEFELGPPSGESIELARVVDRGIRQSNCIDTKSLCLVPNEKVWTVYLDIIIVNHDGNLMDAAGIAAIAALLDAKIPKLAEDGTIIRGEHEKALPIRDIPIPITTRKVAPPTGTVDSGKAHLLDTTALEEDAINAWLTITTKNNGNISAMQLGAGLYTADEVVKIAEMAQKIASEIRKKHFGKYLKSLKI